MREFTLLGFIAHVAAAEAAQAHHDHKALERAAVLIEKTAKAELGHYQDGAGPFAGWAELADATKDDRVQQGYPENEPGLRSGGARDSIGHHVGDKEAVVGTDDDKLVWFELGTEKQPPRSVLGIAAARKAEDVARILGQGAVMGLVGSEVAHGRIPIPGEKVIP